MEKKNNRYLIRITNKRALTLLVLILSFCYSCTKKDNLEEQVNNMNFLQDHDLLVNEIDEWLYENFTKDYNIRVEYKFDRSEVAWKALTPPDESKVIPVAELIRDYFIKIYEAETDEFFIKTYLPKQYMFVGSPEYNPNGTVTTGSALAGRKVTLFRLNRYEGDWPFAERMLKTIHHEFGHILDMNKRVTPEFGEITKSDYVDDEWNLYNEQYAWNLGIITPYAMSEASEDFVEMIAVLITYGQEYFDYCVSKSTAEGAEKLRQKERIVVDYFKSNWDIDFRSLQERFKVLVPEPWTPPSLADDLGVGKKYSEFVYDPSDTEINKSTLFSEVFEQIKQEFLEYENRSIEYFRFVFGNENELRLRMYYRNSNGDLQNNSLRFKIKETGNKTFQFELDNPTSGSIFTYTSILRGFMEQNQFKIQYDSSDTQQGGLYVLGSEKEMWVSGILVN